MSHRLQVLIPEDLDAALNKAAQRNRMSKGEWVRRTLWEAVRESGRAKVSDPVARLAGLDGPAADLDWMLAEIEKGRS